MVKRPFCTIHHWIWSYFIIERILCLKTIVASNHSMDWARKVSDIISQIQMISVKRTISIEMKITLFALISFQFCLIQFNPKPGPMPELKAIAVPGNCPFRSKYFELFLIIPILHICSTGNSWALLPSDNNLFTNSWLNSLFKRPTNKYNKFSSEGWMIRNNIKNSFNWHGHFQYLSRWAFYSTWNCISIGWISFQLFASNFAKNLQHHAMTAHKFTSNVSDNYPDFQKLYH